VARQAAASLNPQQQEIFMMGGCDAAPAAPNLLNSLIQRLGDMAHDLGDTGDRLHGQANRIFGADQPAPSTGTNPAKPTYLLAELSATVDFLQSQVLRVRVGASRLGDLG
jgi:hypothetical protein